MVITPAHALPKLRSQRKELRERARQHRITGAVQGTELYKRWHTQRAPAPASVEHNGRSFPVFLVGEDSLSIEVLTDYASPEWRWLRSTYDELARAVTADGAELVVVVSPLAYQLDPEYPFLPQAQFARYCEERSLACLDLLPMLRDKRAEKPFFDEVDYGRDVWHYSPAGHKLVAEEIATLLEREHLTGVPGNEAPPRAALASPRGAAFTASARRHRRAAALRSRVRPMSPRLETNSSSGHCLAPILISNKESS
jgi:hypothetical protein